MAFHYRKQTEAAATMMHSRLLKDIDELQRGPYPGIELHINEADVTVACLVLTPEGEGSLHLRLGFSTHATRRHYPVQHQPSKYLWRPDMPQYAGHR